MSTSFFDKPAEEQTDSLTQFAHHILIQYGIKDAEVECINFEFNATFSVTTDSGQRYALRLNINSTRNEANIVAEVQWVRALSRVAGINVPSPIATLDDQFVISALHEDSQQFIYG